MCRKLFNITEESMYGLVESMPNSVHIKTVQNGEYVATNKHNLYTYGFTKESELLGLTFDDLNEFMLPYWGTAFIEAIKQFDEKIKHSGKVEVLENLVFRDKNNFIRCQDLHKIPIFQKNTEKPSLIFTMTVEYTDKISQIELYEKYKKMNQNKSDSITYFMKYLNIQRFFYDHLTEKELLCLLSARHTKGHKYIARDLNINIKTVETHLGNITAKLKNTTLANVVSILRKQTNE